eukprot:CAMPEP_0117760456 /NCGR_PEP_ID=MMETSP0947-20121206/16641_1 /TAXON_ID=44440 /ORGANISM="Chattonella subsalsa, Strain CCMP2191" /LENGTH=406 /DNA_ID=CAMNT_0005581151 /DNA_START=198 /DNA_END=1418 /DNA_ORIENTATION=+
MSSGLKTTETKNDLAAAKNEDAVARPIDFDLASQVEGGESQVLTVELEPGQMLRAETGCMLYMTEGVEVEANMGGGISSALSRMVTGQNLMVSDFKYTGPEGTYGKVALGPEFPSKILRMNLAETGGGLICQKGAYMAGSHTINIEMQTTKSFGVGFLGGEGFILQKLTGEGEAFIKAGGTLIRKDLQPGETIRVQSGALVAFTPEVDYDITMMKGVKNMFFGEGMIMTTLTGPGTVWLQGLPFEKMVESIASRIPRGGGIGLGVPIGMGGGGDGGEGGAGEDAVMAAGLDEAASIEGGGESEEGGEGLFGDALKSEDAVTLDEDEEDPFLLKSEAESTFDESGDSTMKEEDYQWGAEDPEQTQDSAGGDTWGEENEATGDSGSSGADEESSSSLFGNLFDMFKDE